MHSHKVGNWSFRIFINDVKAREIMKGIGFWDPHTRVYDDNIDHSAVSTLKIAGVLERCGINSGFTRWLTWLDVICPDGMNHEKSGGLIARTLYASKRMWKLRVAFHGFPWFYVFLLGAGVGICSMWHPCWLMLTALGVGCLSNDGGIVAFHVNLRLYSTPPQSLNVASTRIHNRSL